MKKGDYIIILAVIAVIALVFFIPKGQGASAEIIYDGQTIRTLPLDSNVQITVSGKLGDSIICVQDGSIYIQSAPCHDNTCLKTGKINKTGECIICVPQRLVIKIIGAKAGPDAITG